MWFHEKGMVQHMPGYFSHLQTWQTGRLEWTKSSYETIQTWQHGFKLQDKMNWNLPDACAKLQFFEMPLKEGYRKTGNQKAQSQKRWYFIKHIYSSFKNCLGLRTKFLGLYQLTVYWGVYFFNDLYFEFFLFLGHTWGTVCTMFNQRTRETVEKNRKCMKTLRDLKRCSIHTIACGWC